MKICSSCLNTAYIHGQQGKWVLAPWEECEKCQAKNLNTPKLASNSVSKVLVYNNSAEGTKHDNGKPQLSLLTRESLEAEARAFAYGAKKYDKNNYKKGMAWSRVIDAALRHLTAFNSGESIDSESGLCHLDHAKACIAMLVYYYENKVGNDDR